MAILPAIVLYIVIWFMVFFLVLPINIITQKQRENRIVPGTPSSAPINLNLKRKIIVTTITASIIWLMLLMIIITGIFSIESLDFYNGIKPNWE